MSKWVRIDSNNIVQEVISYNPFNIVNESLHSFYHEVFGEESLEWVYDPDTDTFTPPPPKPDPEPDSQLEVPKIINEFDFVPALSLSERILWNSPETGTDAQKGAINTIKSEFPYEGGSKSMTEVFEILEQVGFFTSERVEQVKQGLGFYLP